MEACGTCKAQWQSRPARGARWAAIIIGAAILLRLALAAMSIGTNDAVTFFGFAEEIARIGVIETYRTHLLFNHPPAIGIWAAAALRIARGLPQPFGLLPAFCFIFKIPAIAADALAAWLLWKRWRPELGPARAAVVAALFAWSLDAILVSAFHCNTDSIYASLCLLAVYLMEDRRLPFWAGVALAAAINVKVIPVLLVAPLLMTCRMRLEARVFLGGLSLGMVPFLPALAIDAPTFCQNVLAYNSNLERWGINFFLLLGHRGQAWRMIEAYHQMGRYFIFASIGVWSLAVRLRPAWDRYEVAAVTFALFLILSPGFGVQYTAILGALLFAARPRIATVYAVVAGAFLLSLYLACWLPGQFPIEARFGPVFPIRESLLGLLAWGVVLFFVTRTVSSRARSGSAPAQQARSGNRDDSQCRRLGDGGGHARERRSDAHLVEVDRGLAIARLDADPIK